SGQALAAGFISARAAGLADTFLRAMFWNKLKVAAILVVVVGLLGAGVGWVMASNRHEEAAAPAPAGPFDPVVAVVPAQPVATRTDALGDPLPTDALARMGTLRLRHGHAARAVVFAPDSRWLISAGDDGAIHAWDADTGKELRRYPGPRGPVTALAL